MKLQDCWLSVPLARRDDGVRDFARKQIMPVQSEGETDVSVVIVSWRDILRGCLRSVFEQTQFPSRCSSWTTTAAMVRPRSSALNFRK
jgi:hypothetical protein